MATEAEKVGEAVTGMVEGAKITANEAVEEAKRKIDEANKTAENIAAAAMTTDLGARISKHEEILGSWHADKEILTNRLSSLEAQNQKMAELMSSQSSTLEKLTQLQVQKVEETPTALIVEAEKSGSIKTEASPKSEVEKPDTEKKAEAKKRQRLWM